MLVPVSTEREKLVQELLARSRELSTATVLFHTAIAESQGFTPIETKTADLLARFGPMTAKELVRHSGLAPASVTALIDRLERKGLARRRPHPEDGRKVLVELNHNRAEEMAPMWDYLVDEVHRVCERFTDDQLRAVAEFLAEGARITHESTERITGG